MMWIAMLEGMSGHRAGGDLWPARGVPLQVDDWEGEHLVRAQLAVRIEPPEGTVSPTLPSVVDLPPKSAPLPAPDEDAPVPGPSDTKGAWAAYAVSQGASQQEAESLTKSQLQSAYGGRLLS